MSPVAQSPNAKLKAQPSDHQGCGPWYSLLTWNSSRLFCRLVSIHSSRPNGTASKSQRSQLSVSMPPSYPTRGVGQSNVGLMVRVSLQAIANLATPIHVEF